MKRFFALILLLSGVLVVPMSCGGDPQVVVTSDSGVDSGVVRQPGVCTLTECPRPEVGIPCCTFDAHCGMDPTGLGIACQPNPDDLSGRTCVLEECPTPLLGSKCCTPLAACGWDPFGNGLLCLPNGPPIQVPDGGQTCDLSECPFPDGGYPPCCQPNGECGVDTGIGFCLPQPTCNLRACPEYNGLAACCLANGECGVDALGVGLCFPPPAQLCDLDECPTPEGGVNACCLANGQCGVDTFNNGWCFPPPPEPTCDLDECPTPADGTRKCCLPNGQCGQDTLGIGICFLPPPPPGDGGGGVVTTPPDHPSITGECPSFIGVFGPVWGCCSDFGVCGTFGADQCLLAVGTPIPTGPPPPPEAGVTEPFLRCTPPGD